MWLSHIAVCPTLHLVLRIFYSPMKLGSTLKDTFMYNCSRQSFPYLGNEIAAIHQECSQRITPMLACRSKGKVTERNCLRKAVMVTSLCPTASPQHFQGEDPFQMELLIQLLHFPQTSGDFSNPKVATIATELTIKRNSPMVSNYWFPVVLCLPLDLQWPYPEGGVPTVTIGPKLPPRQKRHPASKVVDLLVSFHPAAMEDATAQGDHLRSKKSMGPTSQQPHARFAELAQTQGAGPEGCQHLHREGGNSCKQKSASEDAVLLTE